MPGFYGKRLRDAWERLLHFAQAKQFTFHPDAVTVPSKRDWSYVRQETKERRARNNGSGFGTVDSNWHGKTEVYPDNVLETALNATSTGTIHSAVFPSAIPSFFIKLFTVPGDTVLDPFAGSGTTLFTAYEMDRHSIGVEIMPEYCELIRKRKAQLTMRLPGLA